MNDRGARMAFLINKIDAILSNKMYIHVFLKESNIVTAIYVCWLHCLCWIRTSGVWHSQDWCLWHPSVQNRAVIYLSKCCPSHFSLTYLLHLSSSFYLTYLSFFNSNFSAVIVMQNCMGQLVHWSSSIFRYNNDNK